MGGYFDEGKKGFMMAIQTGYITNEVDGSFWRPYDYMAKVSDSHVVAKDMHSGFRNNEVEAAATVSVSEKARELFRKNQDDSLFFESSDGVVRRYSFDIATNNLQMIDIAL